MERKQVLEIIESIMEKFSYTKSIEEVVKFYERDFIPQPSWLMMRMDFDSVKTELEEQRRSIWDDILPSMYTMPDKVYVSDHVCPDCGEKCIQLFFSTPPWTWKALCGRGGIMVICPNCPKMIEYCITVIN